MEVFMGWFALLALGAIVIYLMIEAKDYFD
jgi:hypothetical protein